MAKPGRLNVVAGTALWATLATGALANASPPGSTTVLRAAEDFCRRQLGYEASFARARRFAAQARFQQARQSLEALRACFPQDYQLRLQLGWYAFSARDYAAARDHYRAALTLSPADRAARLGLAWTSLRLGQRPAAHALFSALATEFPEDRSLGLALRASGSQLWLWPQANVGVLYYPDHPFKSWGLENSVGLAVGAEALWFKARYRHTHFWLRGEQLALAGLPSADFSHHELYLATSWDRPRWGFGLRYGLIVDGSATYGTVHQLGLGGRLELLGELSVESSVSFYPDRPVLSVAAADTLRWGAFYLRPEALLGLVDRGVYGAGGGALGVAFSRLGLELGARAGELRRFTMLQRELSYDTPDRLLGSAWFLLDLRMGRWQLGLRYAIDRLASSALGGTSAESTSHYGGLSLALH